MKILLIGGSGLVGSALHHVLSRLGHRVVAPARAEFDILSGPPPPGLFTGVAAAVNAAVAKPPAERAAASRVNAEFPHELSRGCAAAGVKLIHVSTDGVFEGSRGPCEESSVANPADEYGAQKLAGEPSECLVLRTSVIGPERRGFESLLCWFLAQQGPVSGYVDQQWNGVTSLALARAIARLIAQGTIPLGVRHVYSDDVSKYELLSRVAKAFARDVDIVPAKAPAARDRWLRTEYPEFLASCAFPSLDEQLAELPALADARGAWRPNAS